MNFLVAECKAKRRIDFPDGVKAIKKGEHKTISTSSKKGVLKIWGHEGYIWAVDERYFDLANPINIIY